MKRLFGRKKSGSSEEGSLSSTSNSTSRPSQSQALGRNGRRRGGGPGPGAGAGPGPGSRSVAGNTTVFRVPVPDNVRPGEEFQVYANGRIVRVRCPMDGTPGMSLQITVPSDPTPTPNRPASHMQDSPNVQRIEGSDPPAYMVTIPAHVQPGAQFPVQIQGQQLHVTCPSGARPGASVRIVPPPAPRDVSRPPTNDAIMGRGNDSQSTAMAKPKDQKFQLFEVEVPPGVEPGAPFALLAGGVRVLVTCPPNANAGQRIRFKLPTDIIVPTDVGDQAQIKLHYGKKDGWTRTVRATDLKFQWVRMDDNGDVDLNQRFNMEKSAYVRRLEFRAGDDPRIRTGILSLVPATESVVDSKIRTAEGEELISYSDLAQAQVKNFDEKAKWFQETCAKLSVEWNEGHMRINVRREFLLGDSVDAVMSLSRKDLRKVWRFEFIGEEGIDAGGLTREWFELVCKEIFDPDMALWMSSSTNQLQMTINPASEFVEDFLVYYRFLGRVMGKAMFDAQLVNGHMVKHLYKHLLGWPIQFRDLENIDEDYYRNLKQLQDLADSGEDLSMLCLDFTTTTEIMGAKKEIELVKGGKEIDVTNENLPEYVEACLKYKLMGSTKHQLNELLLGFFDVIPEPLMTIFDFQELELLMCGVPEIDMNDWQKHTEYSGDYDNVGEDHQTCQWFWEVVSDLDHEMKARLLQFVTGTSGVPARGFGVLQGNDGNIRKFTIHGVPVDVCLYPRAHTCFNRIDLPLFSSKEELSEKLNLAVTMSSTGFDIE